MKDKIFGVLQRVGRSFMLPIAILPVAGLLLGFGSSFTNATTIQTYGLEKILGDGTILNSLLIIMNKVGSAVFDNLPLIFAVGVAIGMAKKEKEVAALSALIAFFVMNVAINAMLVITGEITADGTIASNVLEGTITSVCGIQSLLLCITVFTKSFFQMRYHSSEGPDLFRSFLHWCTCLLGLECILPGRLYRMEFMHLADW